MDSTKQRETVAFPGNCERRTQLSEQKAEVSLNCYTRIGMIKDAVALQSFLLAEFKEGQFI